MMNTRRENRKQVKLKTFEERMRRNARKKAILGFASLLSIGGVAGLAGYGYSHRGIHGWGASRSVAGLPSAAEQKGAHPGRPIEEVRKELEKKNEMSRKAKEWVWADEGQTELVIEAYRKVSGTNTHSHEERIRLLHALERNAKPRNQWPPAFNLAKAKDVVALAAEVLSRGHEPGPEAVSAIHLLVVYAGNLPEFKHQAESVIYQFYLGEDRPAIRGACLDSLSVMGSQKAIGPLEKDALANDHGSARTALYSLSNYLGTPLSKKPQAILFRVAQKDPLQRPLAAKLLAFHGIKQASTLVPLLLTAQSQPVDVEAAAYLIEHLKLPQYFELLRKYGRTDAPFLKQQVDAAFNSAGVGAGH